MSNELQVGVGVGVASTEMIEYGACERFNGICRFLGGKIIGVAMQDLICPLNSRLFTLGNRS